MPAGSVELSVAPSSRPSSSTMPSPAHDYHVLLDLVDLLDPFDQAGQIQRFLGNQHQIGLTDNCTRAMKPEWRPITSTMAMRR